MNKAQQNFIEKYYEQNKINQYVSMNEYDLIAFAVDYSAIDSTPDPETYSIWLKDKWNDRIVAGGYSKQEAIIALYTQATDVYYNSLVEYKKGEYLLTLSGARYEIRKES